MSDRKIIMSLDSIMGDRYAKYAKYIIQDRALPDVRDGLKPVQRRILYSMFKENNIYTKAYRKSAKTVGNVIGNYHPHGDSSVYEAMVRLSQDWKIRAPLIDMQGNNGSIDNDPAAAMRYTEARLSAIAAELLADINKDTVQMSLNFDDTEYEPTVLPAGYPNLLVNGATGISSGYATDIPPHNLEEVIDDRNLEKSVVTLFEGMNFFIEIALEQKIELPFKTIREYIVQNYEGGDNIYIDLNDRYQKEIKDYTPKKKRFEDIYGKIEFN